MQFSWWAEIGVATALAVDSVCAPEQCVLSLRAGPPETKAGSVCCLCNVAETKQQCKVPLRHVNILYFKKGKNYMRNKGVLCQSCLPAFKLI